jgi:hypothetical protein
MWQKFKNYCINEWEESKAFWCILVCSIPIAAFYSFFSWLFDLNWSWDKVTIMSMLVVIALFLDNIRARIKKLEDENKL